MKSRTRQWVVVIVGLVAVVGILVGVKAGQIVSMVRASESFVPPPEAVTSAKVEATAVGGREGGDRVARRRERRHPRRRAARHGSRDRFESGADVKRGQVLVKLDTSAEEAQLAAAVAEASLAKVSLGRAERLRANEANAQADLDAAEARAKQAVATVANLRATIAKKTIRAPFDGRIAIRQVELGQVVSPGTPIASLQSVSPIHADFWLPQQALAELRAGQRARLRTDVFDGAKWEGEITTVNPEVDAATRNVRVRATFENRGRAPSPRDVREGGGPLAAEAFGARHPRDRGHLRALRRLGLRDRGEEGRRREDHHHRPAEVHPDGRASRGRRRGGRPGLTAGETVVSSGAFKLRNGAAVAVNNALAPDAQLAPKPTDE